MKGDVNMKTIKFYKYDGTLEKEIPLIDENLAKTNGMLLKCYLNNKKEKIGYGDPYRTHDKDSYDGEVHDYINLWTWDNLDEERHQLIGDDDNKYNQTFIKVDIDSIISVEAILYSNPRWGGKLTNKFKFRKLENNQNMEFDIPPFLKKDSNNNDK